VDDSTVAVATPHGSGAVSVAWSHDGWSDSIAVQLHGTVAQRTSAVLSGYALPVAGGPPRYLANGESTLVLMDARNDVPLVTYSRSVHDPQCMLGPGPTYDPTVFLLEAGPPECRMQAWRLGTPTQWIDSLRASTRGTAAGLSSQVLATHRPQPYFELALRGPALPPTITLADGDGFRLSPRGDRALSLGGVFSLGAPVFDTQTGAIAFVMNWIDAPHGAAFSDDGDTLFVAARRIGLPSQFVFVVDATTGDSLTAIALDTAEVSTVWDLALDPNGHWIYITAEKFPGPIMKLAVVRRATLRVETIIPVTPLPGCPDTDRLITSTAERRLYWLRTWLWPSTIHSCVTTFDLMP
jgi:hypothetical protein